MLRGTAWYIQWFESAVKEMIYSSANKLIHSLIPLEPRGSGFFQPACGGGGGGSEGEYHRSARELGIFPIVPLNA